MATADFHGDDEAFRKTVQKAIGSEVDVVLVCGDITHFGSIKEAKELLSNFIGIEPAVLFIPGNCDPPALIEDIEGLKCIHGRCRRIDKINFFGVGGSSPSPFNTPFELTEVDIEELLKQGYGNCSKSEKCVLVSHSPPKNTLVDVAFGKDHVGSLSVRTFVEKMRPSIVVCGHIHESPGIDKVNGSIIVNPGPARHGRCAFIDFTNRIEIKFDQL